MTALYDFIRNGTFLFVLCVVGAVLISSGTRMTPFIWDGAVVAFVGVVFIVWGLWLLK